MKKKMSILLVAIMLFSIILTACGGNEPKKQEENLDINKDVETGGELEVGGLQKIIDSGKLVMGTSADYPPFEFHTMVDRKDKIVGLDLEIAKHIAEELGVELEVKDMDFDNLLGGISSGMLDVVLAGMNPDPERADEVNFTDIYYEANLSVLVTKENKDNIKTLKDLDGKVIGVQIGTTQEKIAQESINDSKVKSLTKNPDIVMNLKTEKIDCAIMETPVAEAFAKVNDDLMVVENLIIDNKSGGVAIAVQKGNDELTEKLNEILADLASKGLIDKWLVEAEELNSQGL